MSLQRSNSMGSDASGASGASGNSGFSDASRWMPGRLLSVSCLSASAAGKGNLRLSAHARGTRRMPMHTGQAMPALRVAW